MQILIFIMITHFKFDSICNVETQRFHSTLLRYRHSHKLKKWHKERIIECVMDKNPIMNTIFLYCLLSLEFIIILFYYNSSLRTRHISYGKRRTLWRYIVINNFKNYIFFCKKLSIKFYIINIYYIFYEFVKYSYKFF